MAVAALSDLYLSNTTPQPYTTICGLPVLFPHLHLRLAGYAILLSSGIFRIWAMRTLGQLFTFKLSIRPSHKLITSGPYEYVRHPSYTGVYGEVLGGNLLLLTGGVGARLLGSTACGTVTILLLVMLPVVVVHMRILRKRIVAEEKMMQGEFKEQWDAYERRVKWKVLPRVW